MVETLFRNRSSARRKPIIVRCTETIYGDSTWRETTRQKLLKQKKKLAKDLRSCIGTGVIYRRKSGCLGIDVLTTSLLYLCLSQNLLLFNMVDWACLTLTSVGFVAKFVTSNALLQLR